MKKYTNEELKDILNDINGGAVYVGITPNGNGVGKIYAPNKTYIRWQHYGQSAQKNTVQDLRYIIENIFNDCDIITPAVYSEYHVNYIPIDKKYNGIDHSYFHPNIHGL